MLCFVDFFGLCCVLVALWSAGLMAGGTARWIYERLIRKHVPPERMSATIAFLDHGTWLLLVTLIFLSFLGVKWAENLVGPVLAIGVLIGTASWVWREADELERKEKKKGPKPTA